MIVQGCGMARPRTVSDEVIFSTLRQLLANGGDRAVGFGPVARATGLAAPTLVQRFGDRDGMVRAALMTAWDRLDAHLADCAARGGTPQAFLKGLSEQEDLHPSLTLFYSRGDPQVRDRATAWRAAVEGVLAQRLGGGAKARDGAALLFAAWQGQMLWQIAGGKAFRLKDAVRRLG
jgi:AcrR family transcriptional regulator